MTADADLDHLAEAVFVWFFPFRAVLAGNQLLGTAGAYGMGDGLLPLQGGVST